MICTLHQAILLRSNQIKDDRRGGACSTGHMINIHEVLFVKLQRKRPLQRPSYRWEENIKMHIDWWKL
jgi:hypothetical protein